MPVKIIAEIGSNWEGTNDLFIEKHVKLENSKGLDSPFSITFDELAQLTNQIKRIEKFENFKIFPDVYN